MYLKKEAGCELTAEENVRWERYISVASRHIPRSHAHSYPLDRCPDEIREVLRSSDPRRNKKWLPSNSY